MHAAADEILDCLLRERGKAELLEGAVERDGDFGRAVDEGAVEVEDHRADAIGGGKIGRYHWLTGQR